MGNIMIGLFLLTSDQHISADKKKSTNNKIASR